MQAPSRKAYEIPVHEVAGFFGEVQHDHLLAAPIDSFLPEYRYLIYIYRNAWTAPKFKQITPQEASYAAIRFHNSLRSELFHALPDERENKKKAFLRTHELCIKYKIVHPVFNFNRKGTVGGDSDGKEIRLNYVLYSENIEEYLRQTIKHELAHHWHFQLGNQGTAHGKQWKALMRRMGVQPDRCHKMDTTNAETLVKKQFYLYSCACPQVTHVSAKRHNHIQREMLTKPVLCFKCKKPIGFDGIDRTLLSRIAQLA